MKRLCLIVPCYNEEERLQSDKFLAALEKYQWLNLCFVNDCSTDNTMAKITEITAHPRAFSLTNTVNSGKARSVQNGIIHNLDHYDFTHFGYWDADLSTPFSELEGLYNACVESLTLVMGARINILGKNINRKLSRHYIGRIFATLASIILRTGVYDTQCGAKIFTREFAEITFKEPLNTGWCFDIELLLRYQQTNNDAEIIHKKVLEHPLNNWTDIEGSKIRLHHIFNIGRDLLYLFYSSRFSKK